MDEAPPLHDETKRFIDYLIEYPLERRRLINDTEREHWAWRDLRAAVAAELPESVRSVTLIEANRLLRDPEFQLRVWESLFQRRPAPKQGLIRTFLHNIYYRR